MSYTRDPRYETLDQRHPGYEPYGYIEQTMPDGSHRQTLTAPPHWHREARTAPRRPASPLAQAKADLDARWDRLIDLMLSH